MRVLDLLSLGVGSIGVAVIVWGSFVSFVELCLVEKRRFKREDVSEKLDHIRHHLGFYLLMGLEFMIGGDIIRTVIRPTLQELAVLGSLVAIRTVISYFLNREMQASHKDGG